MDIYRILFLIDNAYEDELLHDEVDLEYPESLNYTELHCIYIHGSYVQYLDLAAGTI